MADFIERVEDDLIRDGEKRDREDIERETERIEKHEDELKKHDKGLVADYLESRIAGEEDDREVKEERLAEDEKKLG